MINVTFALASRAVCPSCRRPLWRCVCRLPFIHLLGLDFSDGDADVDRAAASLLPSHPIGLLVLERTFTFTYLKSSVAERLDGSRHETA
jgi:hypothetical protein